jgi:Peptidase family M23
MNNSVNKYLSKLLNWKVLSLGLTAVLVPLAIVGTSSVGKAEEFKTRQLIAQSCRNINIRTNKQSRTFRRGARGSTCGYRFNFQSDGNLVLSDRSGQVLWATGTEGRGEILRLQPDGNLVVYGGGKALWATNTDRNPGAFFAIQSDGNLVIYRSDGQPLWASGTDGGQIRTRNAAGEWSGQVQAPQPQQNNRPVPPVSSLNSTIDDCHLGGACATRNSRYPSQHTGVDYFVNAGSDVRAICNGTVQLSQTNNNDSWNSFVIIKHDNCSSSQPIYAYYGHLNSQVSNGQSVMRGETIGAVQNNGNNSHLHFGLATKFFSDAWGYQNGNLNDKGWINPDDFARNYQ